MECFTQKERERQGRKSEPSGGCIDSQSVKAAMQPADNIGFDGDKKVKGRKRHVLTDTLGLIICIVVTAANHRDRDGSRELMRIWLANGSRRLRKI